jgi:hypothetical protein
MSSQVVSPKDIPREKGVTKNSTLLLIGFATVFFPRLFTYFGAPSILNFAHFIIIPIVSGIVLFTTRVKDRQQIAIVWQLICGFGIFLACMTASALINNAGVINVFLQAMFMGEAFLFLIAMMAVPMQGETLKKFRRWVAGFCIFNLALALIQSVLLPIGLYPGARGGQLWTDNTAGVFASPGGSAGNYISAAVSLYFAFYFFISFKSVPQWIRIAVIIASFYQTYVSDSKQTFVQMLIGWLLVVWTNMEKPLKIFLYLIPIVLFLAVFSWALVETDWEFLDAYRNFTVNRAGDNLYGPDGQATLLKTAAFRIVPSYYTTPLNEVFGLGPGHTATRLGGWFLRDPAYQKLLFPLGATIHPASEAFWQLIASPAGWLFKDSTMFSPMYTWVGIWGDLGIIGVCAYLYLTSIVWRRVCVDDFGKFLLLSTAVMGLIFTQMEEPGQMVTVACFLALRWHEERERRRNRDSIGSDLANSETDHLLSPPQIN